MAEDEARDDELNLVELGTERLRDWVRENAPSLTVADLRQILRNPYASTEILSELIAIKHLLAFTEARKGLARHPKLGQIHALRLVPTLFWRDLMELGLEIKVSPVVRRAADRQLIGRLSGLSLGERMTLARRAGLGVLQHLRFDSDRQVIGALLENPRLTQGLLLPLAANESVPPEILRLLSENRRWGVQYPIRLALARNPRTPPVVALTLLPRLKRFDLQALSRDLRLHGTVRRRAQELLGGDGRR
jgi:hypothetical protein